MKFFLLILKNLRRNKVRTALTCMAVMVLVFVVTMIWTVVYFLENFTKEKSGSLKAIVTDRYDFQGQLPLAYAGPLSRGAASKPGDKVPSDSMAWQFYVGTLDLKKQTREDLVILVGMEARQLPTKVGKTVVYKGMIDELDPIDQETVKKLEQTANGCLLGERRLKTLNRKVGDRFKVSGLMPAGIDLEFEVVGMVWSTRWRENGFMNARYLNGAIDAFCRDHPDRKPYLDSQRIKMFWVEAGKKEDFSPLVEQINTSSLFGAPPVKCETFSSLVANYLDSWSGFIWFIQWVLVPASMFSMVLLVANAISLNVRERIEGDGHPQGDRLPPGPSAGAGVGRGAAARHRQRADRRVFDLLDRQHLGGRHHRRRLGAVPGAVAGHALGRRRRWRHRLGRQHPAGVDGTLRPGRRSLCPRGLTPRTE